MAEQILLTIAIPSYQAAGTLTACLESFADPAFRGKLQVLIVNDGSTDETADIALSFVRQCPEIYQLVTQENQGHGGAVMTGIARASGRYFRILDADDAADAEALKQLLERMETGEADAFVDVKREINIFTGKEQLFPVPPDVVCGKTYSFADVCLLGDVTSYIMIHTLSVKTDLLHAGCIELPKHVFYEDYEYITKAALLCSTIQFEDLNVYQYHVGNDEQSVSVRNYVKRYTDHDRVLKDMLAFEESCEYTGNKREYLQKNICLLIHTQMNIGLIFDPDRKRGHDRIRQLRRELESNWPAFARSTKKRYQQALLLHSLRFDKEKLDRLMGRKGQ